MKHNQIPPLLVQRKNAGDDVWSLWQFVSVHYCVEIQVCLKKILVTFPQESNFSLLEKSICKEKDEDEHKF